MERIREISSLSHSLEYCYSPILLSISLHYETGKTKASSSSVTLNNHKCNSEFHHHLLLLQRESCLAATEVASHQMCDTWVAIWTWAKNKKPPSLVRHLLGGIYSIQINHCCCIIHRHVMEQATMTCSVQSLQSFTWERTKHHSDRQLLPQFHCTFDTSTSSSYLFFTSVTSHPPSTAIYLYNQMSFHF